MAIVTNTLATNNHLTVDGVIGATGAAGVTGSVAGQDGTVGQRGFDAEDVYYAISAAQYASATGKVEFRVNGSIGGDGGKGGDGAASTHVETLTYVQPNGPVTTRTWTSTPGGDGGDGGAGGYGGDATAAAIGIDAPRGLNLTSVGGIGGSGAAYGSLTPTNMVGGKGEIAQYQSEFNKFWYHDSNNVAHFYNYTFTSPGAIGGDAGAGGAGNDGGQARAYISGGSITGTTNLTARGGLGGTGGNGGYAGSDVTGGLGGEGGDGGSGGDAEIVVNSATFLTLQLSFVAIGGLGNAGGRGGSGGMSRSMSSSYNGSTPISFTDIISYVRGGDGGDGGDGGGAKISIINSTISSGGAAAWVPFYLSFHLNPGQKGFGGNGGTNGQGTPGTGSVAGADGNWGSTSLEFSGNQIIGSAGQTLQIGGSNQNLTAAAAAASFGAITINLSTGQFNIGAGQNSISGFDHVTVALYNSIINANGTVTGSAPVPLFLTGNANANRLEGDDSDDVYTGLGGNDTILGSAGIDTAVYSGAFADYIVSRSGVSATVTDRQVGRDGADNLNNIEFLKFSDGRLDLATGISTPTKAATIVGTDMADIITPTKASKGLALPSALEDELIGLGGADKLDGGAGADRMVGGIGSDQYWVDNIGDVVVEESVLDIAGKQIGGNDIVHASVSFTLSANVEQLILIGTEAIDGTGNDLINSLTGNGGANTLSGFGGNDSLTGNAGNDLLDGGDGDDALSGGEGLDTLLGGAGKDQLNGGLGADNMYGGAGNDSYTADNSADVVSEESTPGIDGGGTDLVNASVTFALGKFLENLTLTGSGAIDGTGNALGNKLTGNGADNRLYGQGGKDVLAGGAGNDLLVGGAGADTLTGGTGADDFRFDVLETAANKDTIKDFQHGIDHIEISRSAFAAFGLDADGALDPAEFWLGTAATTSDHHLIYNQGNGALYYDSDGAGGAAQVQIALLSSKPVLDAGDFVLV